MVFIQIDEQQQAFSIDYFDGQYMKTPQKYDNILISNTRIIIEYGQHKLSFPMQITIIDTIKKLKYE